MAVNDRLTLPQMLLDLWPVGGILDAIAGEIARAEDQIAHEIDQLYIPSATDALPTLEALYGLAVREDLSDAERRRIILAHRNIRNTASPAEIKRVAEQLSGYLATVTEDYDSYHFVVRLQLPPDDGTGSIPEARRAIDAIKPAHLSRLIVAGIDPVSVRTTVRASVPHMRMHWRSYNLGAHNMIFDGRKRFDGSITFGDRADRVVQLRRLRMRTGIGNVHTLSADVTIDTMWTLDGSVLFGGSRRANAEIVRSEL